MTPNSEEELLHQLSLQKADLAIDVGVRSNSAFSYAPFIDDDVVVVCRKGIQKFKTHLLSRAVGH